MIVNALRKLKLAVLSAIKRRQFIVRSNVKIAPLKERFYIVHWRTKLNEIPLVAEVLVFITTIHSLLKTTYQNHNPNTITEYNKMFTMPCCNENLSMFIL